MDRAGKKVTPLTDDEMRKIFEIVNAGDNRKLARDSLEDRDRTTVNRTYNVAMQFERRDLEHIDDSAASEIAGSAKYETTAHYVQALFLRWRSWKGRREIKRTKSGDSLRIYSPHFPNGERGKRTWHLLVENDGPNAILQAQIRMVWSNVPSLGNGPTADHNGIWAGFGTERNLESGYKYSIPVAVKYSGEANFHPIGVSQLSPSGDRSEPSLASGDYVLQATIYGGGEEFAQAEFRCSNEGIALEDLKLTS